MLYQCDFSTSEMDYSKMMSDVSVKLHGIIMKEIPTELAGKMHSNDYHPFSVFAVPVEDRIVIRVSALNDEAMDILNVFRDKDHFRIYGMDRPLVITGFMEKQPVAADDLSIFGDSNRCRISFVTPAMYKSEGKQMCRPYIEKYFNSVISKYNRFEGSDVKFDVFAEALNECEYQSFQFQSYRYHVSGLNIRGLTGHCDLKLPDDKTKRDLLLTMFQYASYCGVGGKTSMGMGGFTASPL